MEVVFQRTLNVIKMASDIERLEKEQTLRSRIKEEIYTYGVGYKRLTLFLIRERHPRIDLSGIDFFFKKGGDSR